MNNILDNSIEMDFPNPNGNAFSNNLKWAET